MGELIRRAGALVRTTAREVAQRSSPAASTEQVSFDSQLLTWADLPRATHRAARRAGPVVAESVRSDGRHRTDGGHAVAVAIGWRLHEDGVVIVEASRPVRPAAGDRVVPAGPWQHRWARHAEASGAVHRRRGVVTVADELDRPGRRPARPGPTHHADAAEAWRYLPAEVRTAAEALIPDPVVWLGGLEQTSTRDGKPSGQAVRCLLVSQTRALTVIATRSLPSTVTGSLDHLRGQMARAPWIVEQVGFDLAAAPTWPDGSAVVRLESS